MRKAVKICLLIAIVVGGIGCAYLIYSITRGPLPPGETPALELPYTDISHLNQIQGYGQILPDYYHYGIDFSFNADVSILSPCAAVVIKVELYKNPTANNWQTNLQFQLNQEYSVELYFESQATTQVEGQAQYNAIGVKVGDSITAGQPLGQLYNHTAEARLHISILKNSNFVCPYLYLSSGAKTTFDAQFLVYNVTRYACN
jgi:murein DD-endopeptidase MepM/ murein hydrolase activator NlpD